MITLALETATPAAAVAVLDDEVVLAEVVASEDRHHTESLLPAAARLLGELGISVGRIDRVVVDVGPGLFTGLRVGLATARSLAVARGIGLVGLTSLEILAADPLVEHAGTVTAVVDARRGEVFAQGFAVGSGRPRPTTEPMVLAPADLVARLAGVGGVLVGDGALRHAALLEATGLPLVDLAIPSPGVAGRLAATWSIEAEEPTGVLPHYLRDPDAVANFTVAAQIER